MIYKFRSKAAGDVIMLGPTGDRVLALLGKSPSPKGILEPGDMPAAIAALSAAVLADEAQRQQAGADAGAGAQPPADAISLRQRAWPLVDMMKRCLAADEPIVWGA